MQSSYRMLAKWHGDRLKNYVRSPIWTYPKKSQSRPLQNLDFWNMCWGAMSLQGSLWWWDGASSSLGPRNWSRRGFTTFNQLFRISGRRRNCKSCSRARQICPAGLFLWHLYLLLALRAQERGRLCLARPMQKLSGMVMLESSAFDCEQT